METLPQEIIDTYSINITESVNTPGMVIFSLHFGSNYLGVIDPQIKEKTNTWDLISPGGSVISLYKNIKNIHVSCL
jgi:hypothetical protein